MVSPISKFCVVFSLLISACTFDGSNPQESVQADSLPVTLTEIFETKQNDFDGVAFKNQLQKESSFWTQFGHILFLAEGSKDWTETWKEQRIVFAENFLEVFPRIQVSASDLAVPRLRNPNIAVFAIDHRKPFPDTVKKQSYDAIIGMRILCHCHRGGPESPTDKMMCGGIYSHEQDLMEQFLVEVASLMDPKNPSSFAYLEGEEKDPKEHDEMDQTMIDAQKESRKNWQIVIDRLNQHARSHVFSFVPVLKDKSRYKGILITLK